MDLTLFLILFPALVALVLMLLPDHPLRDTLIKAAALILIAGSVIFAALTLSAGGLAFSIENAGMVSLLMQVIEILIAVGLLYLSVKYRQHIVTVLVIAQTGLFLYAETLLTGHATGLGFVVDEFSVIMALIIGIIGSLICIYAVGYMKDFHAHHPEVKDNRRGFFALLFVFLGAMFGVVFCNNLMWLFFFWEITTVCSFLLIGYKWDAESQKNAFWALLLNILGGIGFVAAFIVILNADPNGSYLYMDALIAAGPALALLPASFIGFAGLTKSAQMPFSSWLVGAMVAPTPVSALLHSSTMVKAGVYIIVRFAPIFQGTLTGFCFALVGGVTFLMASAVAVTQSNAKRVLAYSTIANLGLIVACAGIGTYEAIWAAILLIIFHAVAKSLLFLCVGTVEHRIKSRDIEDMGGIIAAMPKIGVMMIIGISGMFLAPFGMLISKWATLRAFVDAQHGIILVALLGFGSALTLFFWTKWMGKLIAVTGRSSENYEKEISRPEFLSITTIAILTVAACMLFPLISLYLVEPYIIGIYGHAAGLGQWNVVIMLMMLVLFLMLPLSVYHFRNSRTVVPRYLGGRAVNEKGQFLGSLGREWDIEMSNYYLKEQMQEKGLASKGNLVCIGLIVLIALTLVMGVAA